jgi:signal transduction histidine kinase
MRAGTGAVQVLLHSSNGAIRLEVNEDAHPLDRRRVKADNSVNGLSSIRDRVALSGGLLSIASEQNGGTKVTAELRTKDED